MPYATGLIAEKPKYATGLIAEKPKYATGLITGNPKYATGLIAEKTRYATDALPANSTTSYNYSQNIGANTGTPDWCDASEPEGLVIGANTGTPARYSLGNTGTSSNRWSSQSSTTRNSSSHTTSSRATSSRTTSSRATSQWQHNTGWNGSAAKYTCPSRFMSNYN